jgi:V8-like Glu-specific endopeptidase
MSQKFFAISAAAVLVLGCGPQAQDGDDGSDELGKNLSAIVGGSTDNGDPAVVAIAVGGQGQFSQFCTGTLVGQKTVLTAAHCIYAYGSQYAYYVTFGTQSWAPTSYVKVVGQTKNPNYNGNDHDFGILQLEKAVTNVTPIEMNATPMSSGDVGRPIRHAGYGVIDGAGNGGGLKRQVTYDIRQVRSQTIESGGNGMQTCGGDSGGPGFVTLPGQTKETVAGVVSYGDQDCTQFGVDMRVDAQLPWIQSVMNQWEAPTCAKDGKCLAGCAPIDQDCACAADNKCTADCTTLSEDPDCPKDCGLTGVCSQQACPVPDPDCAGVGKVCQTAYNCVSRSCVTDAQNRIPYCSQSCTTDADCPTLMSCDTAGRTCLFKQRPEKQLYDECSDADFCVASICTAPIGGNVTRCLRTCVSTADCGNGTCEGDSSGQRFCRPPVSEVRFDEIRLPRAVTEGTAAKPAGCAAVPGGLMPLAALLLALRRKRS